MTILVTGGTGFLGQAVVRRLIVAGEDARVLVRPTSPRRHINLGGATPILGDLADPMSLEGILEGIDAVIHCAAHVAATGTWDDFEAVTIRGTEYLLEAACRQQVQRFVHVSSLGNYGLNDRATITEDFPLDDHAAERGHYTRSKIESEQLVWRYAQTHDLPVTILRPGILYGPGQPPFVARLRLPLGRHVQCVIARRDQLLPLTYVDNMAEATLLALAHDQAIGNVYNIVDQEAIRQGRYLALLRAHGLLQTRTIRISPTLFSPWIAVGEWVCHRLGRTPPIARHQFRRACASVRYDTTRARTDLQWTSKVRLIEALDTMRKEGGVT